MNSSMASDTLTDRARGTLFGLAMGDALGMPSQTLSHDEIRRRYGRIESFIAPYPDHPVSHGLGAAQVTDDTEQALLLARRLTSASPRFDAAGWARDLLEWEADVRARGLRDLLGPSSRAALEAIGRGVDPGEAAKGGTTNGAAMRIAPVGIAMPADDLPALVDAVETTCRVTHNTGEAIAGAAAVAAAISARIDGVGDAECLRMALEAARMGQSRGHAAGERDMVARITLAVDTATVTGSADAIRQVVGTSVASRESVAAAFGIVVLAEGDAWKAAVLAANIGDDTDTIGAIAGAICGARAGLSNLPADKVDALRHANMLDIDALAVALTGLRLSGVGPGWEAAP